MTFIRRITSWAVWRGAEGVGPLVRDAGPGVPPTVSEAPLGLKQLGAGLKPAWKRRLDLHGRAAAEVLSAIVEGVSPSHAPGPRLIFSSRHGNMERTLRLMGQILGGEPPSPADFSMSVHNTLPGIASINWGITQAHTAVAAGADTLLAALTEALCQGMDDPDSPCLLAHVDLPLPEVYSQFESGSAEQQALGLRLETAGTGQDGALRLTPLDMRNAKATPWDHVRALQAFLEDGARATLDLVGQGQAWRLEREGLA